VLVYDDYIYIYCDKLIIEQILRHANRNIRTEPRSTCL